MVNSITVTPVNASGTGLSGSTVTLLTDLAYNVDGNPTGWKWSDGMQRTIGYDSAGLVASYTVGSGSRTLVRDSAGRITGYTHANASQDQGFGYDNLNRLTSHTVNATSYVYSYDANGNRTARQVGASTYANTVSATSNRLTQVQDIGGTASIGYDAAGHFTSDGTNTYTYDNAHRLVGLTDARGNSIMYTLDSAGNRIAEEVRDPSGALRKNVTRSFDALNRAQQVTGAAQ